MFEPTCAMEIKELIMKSPSKSCELDPVPTSLIKQNIYVFAKYTSQKKKRNTWCRLTHCNLRCRLSFVSIGPVMVVGISISPLPDDFQQSGHWFHPDANQVSLLASDTRFSGKLWLRAHCAA